jgi:hypothetical protein
LTGSEASHIPVGRVERASCFTPDNATVSQCQRVSLVKFNYYDNPHSLAIKALDVTADEIAPGLTARVDLVASQGGTSPFCSPLTADQVQSETHIDCILTMRP